MTLGNAAESDPITLVAAGYDAAADAYFRHYRTAESPVRLKYEQLLLEAVPAGGAVLELGCGNGLPLTARLAGRFDVTAIDSSVEQLKRARDNVPRAEFRLGDMSAISFPPAQFDAVAAFYSIFHLPRDRHESLFRSIYSWLKPGGVFVATLHSSHGDHLEPDWFGAKMYWSSHDPDTYRGILRAAGFSIESAAIEESDVADGEKERHLWVVARRSLDDDPLSRPQSERRPAPDDARQGSEDKKIGARDQ